MLLDDILPDWIEACMFCKGVFAWMWKPKLSESVDLFNCFFNDLVLQLGRELPVFRKSFGFRHPDRSDVSGGLSDYVWWTWQFGNGNGRAAA